MLLQCRCSMLSRWPEPSQGVSVCVRSCGIVSMCVITNLLEQANNLHARLPASSGQSSECDSFCSFFFLSRFVVVVVVDNLERDRLFPVPLFSPFKVESKTGFKKLSSKRREWIDLVTQASSFDLGIHWIVKVARERESCCCCCLETVSSWCLTLHQSHQQVPTKQCDIIHPGRWTNNWLVATPKNLQFFLARGNMQFIREWITPFPLYAQNSRTIRERVS